jgi:RsmE family RNA methyltransferase
MNSSKISSKIRLFLEGPFEKNKKIFLDKAQSHYLNNVMRLDPGHTLSVFNGHQGLWQGQFLKDPTNKTFCVSLEEMLEPQPIQPFYTLYLAFALIKRWEWTLSKACELGVHGFIPLITQRTVLKNFHAQRAKHIIVESCEQSRYLHVPTLSVPQYFEDLLQKGLSLNTEKEFSKTIHIPIIDKKGNPKNSSLNSNSSSKNMSNEPIHIVCHSKGSPWPYTELQNILKTANIKKSLNENLVTPQHQNIILWVGPEGGWSPQEELLFSKNAQVLPLQLNANTLRAETASTIGIAFLKAFLEHSHS